MRIKTVCELTGLSDRTIRYYIEEELLAPAFVENYLGRRTFEFCDADVRALKDVAVLRKFGFSISEIKAIKLDPQKSKEILVQLRNKKQKVLDEEGELLIDIDRLEQDRAYTVEELAEALDLPVGEGEVLHEDVKKNVLKTLKKTGKTLFVGYIGLLPVTFFATSVISDFKTYAYPYLTEKWWLFFALALMPSFVILLLGSVRRRHPVKKLIRRIALAICFLYLPISFLFSSRVYSGSMTEDFSNYRNLDAECIANNQHFYQELFPPNAHYFENVKNENGEYETVYLDASYYYHFYYGFDYTFDIIAEWPLEEECFEAEIERVKELFEKYEHEDENGVFEYAELEKGSYKCLVRYDDSEEDEPFQEVTDSYLYYIFAYDEKAMKVRYIMCDSMDNGDDQPYYLSLEW